MGTVTGELLFADEPWYRDVRATEHTFEGVLHRQLVPKVTSSRWNPVRLRTDHQTVHEVYLGSTTDRLDDYLGRRVRMEGKLMEVLQHREIWPARIERLSDPEENVDASADPAAPPRLS